MSQFIEDTPTGPYAFVQWKGTDVCMDFHCECGAHCHFDGDFAYAVKCPHCGTVWEMPAYITPRKLEHHDYRQPWTIEHVNFWLENAKPLPPDEDWCEEI